MLSMHMTRDRRKDREEKVHYNAIKGALERKAYRDKQGGPRFTVKEPDTEEEIIEEEPTKTNEDFFNVCNEKKIEKPKKKSRSKSRDKKPKNQKPKSQIA